MIKNLFDTFSLIGFLGGLAFGLVIISKFPVVGFGVVMFATFFSIVALVNAVDDGIKSKRNDTPTD